MSNTTKDIIPLLPIPSTPLPTHPPTQPSSISPLSLADKIATTKIPNPVSYVTSAIKNMIGSDSVNGKRMEKNGFIYITVSGTPQERGFSHGKLLGDRIIKFIRTFAFFIWTETGRDLRFFIEMINDFFKSIVEKQYGEFYDEMKGIADGLNAFISENTDTIRDDGGNGGELIIKNKKIRLPKGSYINRENSGDGATDYTDGEILIDVTVDVIFLLNCICSLDYLYSKLHVLIPKNELLNKKPMYSDYSTDYSTDVGANLSKEGGSAASPAQSFKQMFFGGNDKCSAFMAVGSAYTEGGEIVCAHITFDSFISGQFDNILLYIDTSSATASKDAKTSHNILMQTFAGGIWSSTDFFVTSAGFVGAETTIGGFHAFELNAPICVRARRAMQYSNTLDDYVTHLKQNNSGDYACVWYIGKTNKMPSLASSASSASSASPTSAEKDEIMRIELGLKYVNVEKKTDGYFIGFNACYDARIRNLECTNDGFFDIRRHSGARRVRLEELMVQYKGKINTETAKLIIADHYDVYTKTELKCSRTVCAHYELDERKYMSQESRPKPFQPRGALDAKIGSSSLCKQMKFLARWGSACGTPFDKTIFCDNHKQWDYQRPFLEDRKGEPWIICSSVRSSDVTEQNKIDNAIIVDDKTGKILPPLAPLTPLTPTALNPVPTQEQLLEQPLSPTQEQLLEQPLAPSARYIDEIVGGLGGGGGDKNNNNNNNEMKQFMRMFKNKKSNKARNNNTKRNKKNSIKI